MTPNDMITLIKLRLASSNDSNLDTTIITVANLVQERLQQAPELPWFLFVDTNVVGTNLSTVASTETVALPSNFLREDEDHEYVLFVQDTDEDDPWVQLTKDDYSVIKARYTGTGQPTHYDILGSYLYLRKIPDAVYTLRLLYRKKDSVIAAGTTENLWMTNVSDWILAETGKVVAETVVPMPSIAAAFGKEAMEAKVRVMNDTVARNEAARRRFMGDN
ncbi:MAG: phage adaptor protein [bacterium]